MFGWRARIGVLLPPGNPTVEPELWGMAPAGVSLHFARIETPPSVGKAGLAEGMEERVRAYREGLAGPTAALGQVAAGRRRAGPHRLELRARLRQRRRAG